MLNKFSGKECRIRAGILWFQWSTLRITSEKRSTFAAMLHRVSTQKQWSIASFDSVPVPNTRLNSSDRCAIAGAAFHSRRKKKWESVEIKPHEVKKRTFMAILLIVFHILWRMWRFTIIYRTLYRARYEHKNPSKNMSTSNYISILVVCRKTKHEMRIKRRKVHWILITTISRRSQPFHWQRCWLVLAILCQCESIRKRDQTEHRLRLARLMRRANEAHSAIS